MFKSRIRLLKEQLGLISASATTVTRLGHATPSTAKASTKIPDPAPVSRPKLEEIFLHIGSHKTGTSAIQLFLKKNAARLVERLDLATMTPHPWPLQFRAEEARMRFRPEGFQVLGATRTKKVLLTHECYSWLYSPEDLATLHAVLKKHASRVTVILYIRRQDAMAVSMKQEGTKWVDCATAFGHELDALPSKLTALADTYLRYDRRVKLWADAFGKENLVVRLFERSRLKNGDAIQDFMEILGEPDLSGYKSVGQVNASLTRKQQLFLHQTRAHFPELTPAKHLLVEIVRSMDLGDKEKLLPSAAEARAFYEPFREGNAKLNAEFGLSQDPFLFSEDFSAYPDEPNGGALSEDELLTIFSKVVSELAYRLEGVSPDKQVERTANWLRDQALKREQDDVQLALLLMRQAHRLKPSGPFIKRKIAEYEQSTNE